MEKVPTAPLANRAVNVAMSSLSTGSFSSPTAAAAWPTVAPSGTGRSLVKVWKTAPLTLAIGPQRYSPRSIRWLPMSASAPVPGPPLLERTRPHASASVSSRAMSSSRVPSYTRIRR